MSSVQFYLYTNQNESTVVRYGDTALLHQSGYQRNASWKVLIHGFLQHKDAFFPRSVKDGMHERDLIFLKFAFSGLKTCIFVAYMLRMEFHPKAPRYNVLVVDWGNKNCFSISSRVKQLLSYNTYAECTTSVALKVAQMLVFLYNNEAIRSMENIHIIGFSLGAHVAGQAGRNVTDLTGHKIGRITGDIFKSPSIMYAKNDLVRCFIKS